MWLHGYILKCFWIKKRLHALTYLKTVFIINLMVAKLQDTVVICNKMWNKIKYFINRAPHLYDSYTKHNIVLEISGSTAD